MSRAFRICVRENMKKTLEASDHVSTQLELLPILPADQLGELLTTELLARGFVQNGDQVQREDDGIVVRVTPATAEVTVQVAVSEDIELTAKSSGFATSRGGKAADRAKEALRREVHQSLENRAALSEQALQADVTARLEAKLKELELEMNQVVNRVTAEARKRKAGQLGAVKEVHEDLETGSMTIVVEV